MYIHNYYEQSIELGRTEQIRRYTQHAFTHTYYISEWMIFEGSRSKTYSLVIRQMKVVVALIVSDHSVFYHYHLLVEDCFSPLNF